MADTSTDNDLQSLFRRAAEIAKVVPESMQEAAFHRALDSLMGHPSSAAQRPTPPTPRRAKVVQGTAPSNASATGDSDVDAAEVLLQEMDRTAHPEVLAATNVRDRSLLLLRAARDQHDIDGLTSAEIAKVLTEKFRIKTTDAAARMGLDRAADLVHRVTRGQANVYRIMVPGERYLEQLATGEGAPKPPRGRTSRAKKGGRKPGQSNGSPSKEQEGSTGTAGRKARAKNGRPGPKGALETLIEEGFFREAQSIGSIIEHLTHNRAIRYKTQDIAPTLTRLLREGKLVRARNADNQYEYRHP